MSDQTKRALDEAISAHIADEVETGVIVTGYVLHASYVSHENVGRGTHGYFAEFAEDQPYHVAYGLVQMLSDKIASDFDYGNDADE
ncbi:hypothetical protein [Microbacterium lacus]|uniref:hypothetical protein n=1 Tax=Microbacterium lacus TaxID=415217 RepID=UPI000C2C76B9|nr:hypothetical protein [Microbacterium lacus]